MFATRCQKLMLMSSQVGWHDKIADFVSDVAFRERASLPGCYAQAERDRSKKGMEDAPVPVSVGLVTTILNYTVY